MSELAREVGFSPSRLSHAVSRMEEDGWVERSRSEVDRRGTEASLTDNGAKVVEEATPAHLALVKKLVFEELGDDRAAAMSEAMDQIGRASRS
jgi:DNA-binding MarR family transcriptional regulator